jgi:hypothetical protein
MTRAAGSFNDGYADILGLVLCGGTGSGPPQPSFTENFDGVTPPALPPGWIPINVAGPPPFWATSATSPDTAPNDAFLADIGIPSDKVLDSPNITITSASAQLSFRNNYDTEFSGGVYYDGGVLEVSSPNINGGDFLDITDPAVGGSFVSGGYTGVIDDSGGNPLGGRLAWSGNSGGYINTVVKLGPNVNGQTIRLRFRMGTDGSVGAPGWRIDTLSLVSGPCQPPDVLSAVSRKVHGAFNGDIPLPLTGSPGIECRTTGGSNDYQMRVTFANPVVVGGSPQAQVISGAGGLVGTGGVGEGGAVSVNGSVVAVPLTNVPSGGLTLKVKLFIVSDGFRTGDIVIPMDVLIGDTTGNGTVNSSDVSQTKLKSGQAVTTSNFRQDVNVSGAINSSDVSTVKSKAGTALP